MDDGVGVNVYVQMSVWILCRGDFRASRVRVTYYVFHL